MDLSWYALTSQLQLAQKNLTHPPKLDEVEPSFRKASLPLQNYVCFSPPTSTHPPKLDEVEPSFRKVSLPPAKLCMLFPAHLWVRVLATHLPGADLGILKGGVLLVCRLKVVHRGV